MRKIEEKAHPSSFILRDDELFVLSKGWAEMIRKVYKVDPMICAQCGGQMQEFLMGSEASADYFS